jgi:glycosyltransferase involved in cell wall biosynthesis
LDKYIQIYARVFSCFAKKGISEFIKILLGPACDAGGFWGRIVVGCNPGQVGSMNRLDEDAFVEYSDSAKLVKRPEVSVVMVTYNHERYLAEAIEGVVRQETSFPIELLIGEDCSTDRTREIALSYQKRFPEMIRVITSEHNVGAGENLARLIAATRGKYVCSCEGDDYWCDLEKLQRQIDFLKNNPEYGMCYSKVAQYIQEKSKFSRYSFGSPVKTTIELMQRNCVPTHSTCVRKDLYLRYLEEIHPEQMDWKMGDYPLWLWVSYNSKMHFENRITAVYRVLQESASHTDDISKWLTFFKSIHDITRFFSLKYNIPVKKMYIEYDENRAKGLFAFYTLNRRMLVEAWSKAGGLSLKWKICLMLCKSRFLFWMVVLYKKHIHDR